MDNVETLDASSGPFPLFLAAWIQLIVPQPCFDKFFVDFDFLNVPCLKVVISKGLGYAIILGSLIVKVPQIVKMLRARSGEGISMMSLNMELLAISASWSYGYASKFPFSAYGEAVFLAIQTTTIAALVLFYRGNKLGAVGYVLLYIAEMVFLLSPYVPFKLLSTLQASNAFIIMISKLIQAYANFRAKSTGQLSVVTVYLIFLGAVARIFTSVQETGDSLVVFTYVVSSVCNGVIALQMVLYWNSEKSKRE
ncbi:mannose-P-dolichol utilization defect 1 protein-like [Babylonia areolata]|uniref:mannose-P-dolichol utilization defect 1 protein-like n=1 Tax=Babylonia areolata TaxID=304850 RepID=UPI003FCF363F